MPSKFVEPSEQVITILTSAAANGLTLAEISKQVQQMPQRSLQRLLSDLVASHEILREGKGKATKYFRGAVSSIPLSPSAQKIRQQIKRPIQQRKPVGYKSSFLDSYAPNKTFYLLESHRKKLKALGQTPAIGALAGTFAKNLLQRLLIDLSWGSSALEGNTYTLLDTKELILNGKSAKGKDLAETQMILNHKGAIEYLIEGSGEALRVITIRQLHALLSENLLADASAEGQIRIRSVEISGSVFQPLEIPLRIEETFFTIVEKANKIEDPFEQSFFFLVHIPYLQPFEDVNKRVSRLLANLPLIRENLVPLSFIDVPREIYLEGILGIYEMRKIDLLRDVFLWAYERSSQKYRAVRESLGEPDEFKLKYREEIKDIIHRIVTGEITLELKQLQKTLKKKVQPKDVNEFIRVIQAELNSLHEGNFAKYKIRPSEFEKWKHRRNKG